MTEPTGRLSFGDAAARIATGRIAGAFATTTALKALPPKARQDGMIGLVMAGLELYAFDEDSTSPSGLTPDAGSGRWMPVGAGGGGASDATSPLRLVRAASTGALAAATYTSGTLLADANGALNPVDGVTLAVGDRFFYKDHGTATRRGIYVITSIGGAGSKWSMVRASDFDESADLSSGALIVVSEGTVNADQIWMLSVNEAITLDTTSLTFTKLPSLADLASTANGLGASLIGVEDAGGIFGGADTVESALAEVKTLADATAAAGQLKASKTVLFSDLTDADQQQDIAFDAALPAGAVIVGYGANVTAVFDNVGDTASVTFDLGTAAGLDDLVDGGSLNSVAKVATPVPAAGPKAGQLVGAVTPSIRFDADVNLNTLTKGSATFYVLYTLAF